MEKIIGRYREREKTERDFKVGSSSSFNSIKTGAVL